jgi:alpha-L-arabinofuranosidase
VNYKKWNPDLINFDSSRVYGLPSYYVQKMFSENRGDFVLPLSMEVSEEPPPVKAGGIGVGTWRTQAEFKDIKVSRGAETLYEGDFAQGTEGWELHGGDWSVEDGVLRQKSLAENIRAFAGDRKWTNYTYTLKARKLAGDEGFLIPFLVQDPNTKAWWNIGGWGNTRHAIEMDGVIGNDERGRIETGRWYDIRIEVQGAHVKCFLDGRLVHDASFPRAKALYAVASDTSDKHKLFVKVVNVSSAALEANIEVQGAKLRRSGSEVVLASDKPEDENTLDAPTNVAPISRKLDCSGSSFRHTFPANSVTVLRLSTEPSRRNQ